MSADDHLGLQFKHTEDDRFHHLMVTGGGSGVMHWSKDTGEVHKILVPERYQRQGIATAMYREAQGYDPPARHSPVQSVEGAAWARSLG